MIATAAAGLRTLAALAAISAGAWCGCRQMKWPVLGQRRTKFEA